MGRRSRIRRLREEDLEELLEQEEVAPENAPAKAAQPETPVTRALDLQKTAGNRATGAAIARWPFFGVTQATAQWPKERQLILDGEVLPLDSVQEAVGGNATLGSAAPPTREADLKAAGEIHVTIKLGDWSSGLFKASMSGKTYKTVEIVLPGKDGRGVRWILTDVVISGYSTSSGSGDPFQSLTLNFKNREFSQSPPPPR